ncbi:5'-nucleotidase domain-containing protein 1 [Lingula anatina]|uniref:5'-nucleotidase domain-containing protein 1 n=1 Tax=Lingula anatina TaxID=7574 RepID=A0A1S3HI81_LINAN|nr:5'-nucleotidase domain-containing protein 1 [Lingula anatina]|eukprot:XP_013385820.1 5'-nucleotidase domain-containing protein 1 [Lingula anatina]
MLFDLSEYDAVGFDLDHTLAKYKVPEMMSLSFDAVVQYLVKEKGYDEDLCRPFSEDEDFCTKGLIYDKIKGNFLKLDENGKILRASHGTRFMTDADIEEVFGKSRKWEHSDELMGSVNNADTYMIFENYFDMIGILIFGRLVDMVDKKAEKPTEDYKFLWNDVIAGYNNSYRHQAFTGLGNGMTSADFHISKTKICSPYSVEYGAYSLGKNPCECNGKWTMVYKVKLSFDAVVQYLVKEKGYDEDLCRPFSEDEDFCTKGLIYDKIKGNFLKLDENGKILRASHGTRFMTDADIEEVFGKSRKWEHSDELMGSVNNADTYMIFENYFDMIGILIFGRLVDMVDKKAEKPIEDYKFLWNDVIAGYNNSYRHQAFTEDAGGFFPAIKKDVEKYCNKRTEEVKSWLRKLKEEKKTVFMLTTSYVNFASHVAEYSLGSDWKSYFDIIITNAKKPGFFHKNNHFLRLDGDKEREPVQKLERNHTYSQGNLKGLVSFLQEQTEKENPKVAFFGDSLRSDVFPSKMYANWETVYVLEEMETEGMVGYECTSKGQKHTIEVQIEDDGEPKTKKMKTVQHELPSKEEQAFLSSSLWGSFFRDETLEHLNSNETKPKTDSEAKFKHMNTFWGYLTRKYADIAVPQLEYIADFPLDHKYQVFDHENEHKSGFYPGIPKPLQL